MSLTDGGVSSGDATHRWSKVYTQGVAGTTTNDAAAAGDIGEAVSSNVLIASAVSATGTGQRTVITSISLTAGDWDVSGLIVVTRNSATMTGIQVGIGTASGDNETGFVDGSNSTYAPAPTSDSFHQPVTIPPFRVSISASGTYYLKFYGAYSAGTPKAFGRISARRVR